MPSLLLALLLAARPFTPEELLATRRADDVHTVLDSIDAHSRPGNKQAARP
ncbi:MAG: hypothetical protein ACXWLR_08700 [Myxococcales bacterium]